MHSVVYVKWNDACEAEDMQDAEMDNCVQEVAGFLLKELTTIITQHEITILWTMSI